MSRLKRIVFGCFLVAAVLMDARPGRTHEGEQAAGCGGGEGEALFDIPCVNGLAGPYPCNNVDLLAYLPRSAIGGGESISDLWGWTDPQTGTEYAIVGRSSGTAFVDLSDPKRPVYVGELPTQTYASAWREIKVYGNHALIVSEANFHGMQVFDLTQLRGVTNPPVTFTASADYTGFGSCHNLVVNEASGFAYAVGTNTCSGGLHMIDVSSPLQPTFAGCFKADGYTHDAQCVSYTGPDTRYGGREICFSSNGDTLTIVDVTSKDTPVTLSRTGYRGSGYVHQGWLTEDQGYFLLDDELDERADNHNTRTYVWDVSDLQAPRLVGAHTASTAAIDHNQFTRRFASGEYTFQANYRAGLRVLRLDDLAQAALHEVAYFDIFPADDARRFNGAWGTYPFFPSGIVIVSGIEQGLFVLRAHLEGPAPTPTPAATPIPAEGCPATPSTGCRDAGKSSLSLNIKNPARPKLKWTWLNGAPTAVADFGNPVSGITGYAVCVYDESAGTPDLVGSATVPPGRTCANGNPCWKPRGCGGAAGFKYYSREPHRTGLRSIRLRAGLDGRAWITVDMMGQNFSPPPPASTSQSLHQDNTVTVQLRRTDNGACWQGVYSGTPRVNSVDTFKARFP